MSRGNKQEIGKGPGATTEDWDFDERPVDHRGLVQEGLEKGQTSYPRPGLYNWNCHRRRVLRRQFTLAYARVFEAAAGLRTVRKVGLHAQLRLAPTRPKSRGLGDTDPDTGTSVLVYPYGYLCGHGHEEPPL